MTSSTRTNPHHHSSLFIGGESSPFYKYKKAYFILMEYWDSLPDEEKPKIHNQLEEIGL